jgi:hypothetical protein
MLPFTIEQFLGVFEQYNQAIWPMHIVDYLLGLAILALTITKIRFADQIISVILAGFWVWMGIVYHIGYFRIINPAALGFGLLFLVQGGLWLYYGVVRPKLAFHIGMNPYAVIGLVLIGYAMLIYPLIGTLLGHGYPHSPSFGVAPCPTTIFTFGLLLMTTTRVPRLVLVIPFIWALIGFVAALSLGIREDIGLLVAGALCVALLLWRDRASAPQPRHRERYA